MNQSRNQEQKHWALQSVRSSIAEVMLDSFEQIEEHIYNQNESEKLNSQLLH